MYVLLRMFLKVVISIFYQICHSTWFIRPKWISFRGINLSKLFHNLLRYKYILNSVYFLSITFPSFQKTHVLLLTFFPVNTLVDVLKSCIHDSDTSVLFILCIIFFFEYRSNYIFSVIWGLCFTVSRSVFVFIHKGFILVYIIIFTSKNFSIFAISASLISTFFDI